MAAVLAFVRFYQGEGPAARQGPSTTIILPPHSSVSAIANSLERNGVIRSATVFIVAGQEVSSGGAGG